MTGVRTGSGGSSRGAGTGRGRRPRRSGAGRLDPAAIAAANPDLAVASITPFGLDTPWSDKAATEFTLQGWSGGMIGLGRGAPDRPPVHVAGQVGEWLAGAYAAVALLAQRRTGSGGVVDLSMLEVQALCLTYYPVTFHDFVGRPMRKKRALTVPGVAAASDGLVGLGRRLVRFVSKRTRSEVST